MLFLGGSLVIVCLCSLYFSGGLYGGLLTWLGLTFIGTDPEHERRGAASLLARWGLERSMSENVPIALESTMDAVPFYERLGFRPEAHISMPLHGLGKDGESVLYEEVCLVFRPSNFPSSVDPIPLGSSSLRCL